ncbi:MAG: sporulation protein YunB, partial [Clostridiales bacterium]|nr:sporulation protein YunB [Clostridiales bacterium]
FLNGKGPNVKFKFSQVGSPEVSLKSTFSSSGINQTLHQIYAYIEIEVYSIAPKKSKPVLFKFDYLITETVIVGEIPDTYISIPKK